MTTLTLTAQEELSLELDLWDIPETLGDFLKEEEEKELGLSRWSNTTFGEKFLNMKKIWPLKGVHVKKGYISLVDK